VTKEEHWAEVVVAGRGITRLCHFTAFENLESIISSRAIKSRATLQSTGAHFVFNDPGRYDSHPELVSFTIEYPNVYMIEKLNNNLKVAREWVVLCVDPLQLGRPGVLFSRFNASHHDSELVPGIDGFMRLFSDEPNSLGHPRSKLFPPSVPTDLQAEALIPDPIPISAVLAIVTPSATLTGRVQQLLTARDVDLPVHINPRFLDKTWITRNLFQGNTVHLPNM